MKKFVAKPASRDRRPKKYRIVEYMVATGEDDLLRDKYHKQVDSWESVRGDLPFRATVGKVMRHPVNVEFRWVRINGHLIGFYHACSRFVDHDMVERWVDRYFTPPIVSGEKRRCGGDDFGFALAELHIELKPKT